jgi:hypothetical protein
LRADRAAVEMVMNHTAAWRMIEILMRVSGDSALFSPCARQTFQDLEHIAGETDVLVVQAHDREGLEH